jgi:hypothetical protein
MCNLALATDQMARFHDNHRQGQMASIVEQAMVHLSDLQGQGFRSKV